MVAVLPADIENLAVPRVCVLVCFFLPLLVVRLTVRVSLPLHAPVPVQVSLIDAAPLPWTVMVDLASDTRPDAAVDVAVFVPVWACGLLPPPVDSGRLLTDRFAEPELSA